MRVVHVVVTDAFAGTEKYVADVARRTAERGHDVLVLGGDPAVMPDAVAPAAWRPAGRVLSACSALVEAPRPDVVHAHLTAAETAAFLAFPRCRAAVVSTRHIAAHRGSSVPARLLSRALNRFLSVQIAISQHVAASLERLPDVVLPSGVPSRDVPYDESSRVVLVVQRLEAEKDAATALRAWAASGLDDAGWELHLAGDGKLRAGLEGLAAELGLERVRFLGMVHNVSERLAASAIFLATSRREGLGLAVLEAMAAGRPVVATAVGGHLETLPAQYPGLFPVGDGPAAGRILHDLSLDPQRRRALGEELRARQRLNFEIEQHVDHLIDVYKEAALRGPAR